MPDINSNVGQRTEVTLKSIAGSTGYIQAISQKPTELWLEGEDTHVEENGMHSGMMIFSFIGAEKCQDYIQFILVRPWNLEDIAQKLAYAAIIN